MPVPKPNLYQMPIHVDSEPLNVEETIKIQTKMNYEGHVIWRIVGFASLIAFLTIPYFYLSKFLDRGAALFSGKLIVIYLLKISNKLPYFIHLNLSLDPQTFCQLATLLTAFLVYPSLNLVYLVIYKLNHPFFEQYKDNDQPWPWVTDPVKFRRQLIKSIKQIAFNNFVVAGGFAIFVDKILGLTYKYSLADLPSL